ncbi:MAG: hypothetical protein KBD01_12330 [Acidobacteria bacterium]|nr:hypothetical protein [Acidobacteriota bacterium]
MVRHVRSWGAVAALLAAFAAAALAAKGPWWEQKPQDDEIAIPPELGELVSTDTYPMALAEVNVLWFRAEDGTIRKVRIGDGKPYVRQVIHRGK